MDTIRKINYYQHIPRYGEDGEIIETERVYRSVISYNDHAFEEQLATVKGYCGEDYTVEESADEMLKEAKQRLLKILDEERVDEACGVAESVPVKALGAQIRMDTAPELSEKEILVSEIVRLKQILNDGEM